jgi:hypothetical protein
MPLLGAPISVCRGCEAWLVLADGTYDAMVVEVEAGEDGGVAFDLAIMAGAHKGEVVRVVDHASAGEPLDLLGIPAVLTVAGGEPSVSFEG